MIHPDLLKILVCPDARAPLAALADGSLISTDPKTRRLYRVEDGIPILLVEESRQLEPAEHERLLGEARKRPENKAAFQGKAS